MTRQMELAGYESGDLPDSYDGPKDHYVHLFGHEMNLTILIDDDQRQGIEESMGALDDPDNENGLRGVSHD